VFSQYEIRFTRNRTIEMLDRLKGMKNRTKIILANY